MTTSSTATRSSAAGAPLPAGYGYEWARFADWCAATDRRALPAHPITVAEYLDEHPAPPATQRRRLAAITRAHSAAGHPSPARASAIRALLRSSRSDPAGWEEEAARRAVVAEIVAALPTSGWPHGLFGRRDGLLLVLTQLTDLTDAQISRLRRGDLHTDRDGQLRITSGPWDTTVLAAGDDPRSCPGCIHRRWAWIGQVTDRSPAVRTLRDALRRARPVTKDDPHRCTSGTPAAGTAPMTARSPLDERPLLTPIDSWGYQPVQATALSAKAIGHLITAHVNHSPAAHRRLPAPVQADDNRSAVTTAPTPMPRPSPAEDAASRAAYLERRRRDHQQLTQASSALTDIDSRARELLQRTLTLLEAAQLPVRHRTS